ncbi:putative flavoprotein [Aggregatibacter actinomycetemcomitans serotype e str. SC1083]|uniref:Putative flavoprotein n=1 Tax=Aggregatibacter actinomycetemcomitans serotype e str. SC1083 TaxID=907488 RepID=G4AAA7_AGGAC|nr:NAD(P)/FAD-dependent oxidoreductase [Aggregatibacter actinomycetemcomitans]EGY33219.1 putative flavoprotein [Aggregatibacter actinomycetemcomitans serotype e str. SC1083]KYK74423.1 flavoprotein [Aggregatibacter actinomycetemcomitans serotype e str. SA3096]KYK95489.1 flavoprotein [Aggregatibacter actinomycetemcomitans serotype e str. ANH9776]TYB20739.1 NAD(P)/FAD-dependent oxidoreductase [Aggregatibacter actinomycetemcomitans]
MSRSVNHQTLIIGAGAAGLFCAAQLAKRGGNVRILDNGKKVGRKILMSGGGFCNFTNMEMSSGRYLSQNRHFVKSALKRFTQWDFIGLVADYGIAYHEKEPGQLFCDNGAEDIVNMLLAECKKYGVEIALRQNISAVEKTEDGFCVTTNGETLPCRNLVVATGGLSMPGLGATPFGYQLAQQFGINVIAPRASLVPFTRRECDKFYAALSGISLDVAATNQHQTFTHQMLFTHRGLSGPAILQISNYWQPGESIHLDLLPYQDIRHYLDELRQSSPKLRLKTALIRLLPKKLVELWLEQGLLQDEVLAQLSKVRLENLVNLIHNWQFVPNGTEGYRTAEVTMGGVDTHEISSKTMESNKVSGLYFIGEVLDVAGWLGGYNFQWAWSSAYACAQAIAEKA